MSPGDLETQSAARTRESHFRAAVIDTLPANVAVLDAEGTIVAVNAQWLAFSAANGGDPNGYVGTSYFGGASATAPIDRFLSEDEDAERAVAGVREVVAGRRERFDEHYPCHTATEERWFRMTASAITGGGAVVTHFDVSDLVHHRLELERAQRRLRAVFDAVGDALCAVDGRGFVTEANPAAEQLLAGGARIVGKDLRTFFGTESGFADGRPATASEVFDATIADGRPRRILQATVRGGDGTAVPVALGIAPLGIGSVGAEGAVVTMSDLREWVALEAKLAAVQRLESLGQLTGGLAHDFNNLLMVVTGNAELIAAADVPPSARRAAQLVQAAAERGAAMTRRLLAFSSRQPLAPEPVALEQAVRESVAMLAPTIGAAYALEVDVGGVRGKVFVDRVGFDSALLNLVFNARDAMPDGGSIEVVGREEAVAGDGGVRYVRLEVRDRGPGVPAALRDRVFEPFFTTKSVGQGTGLGLSMVHGFARRCGGHVDVTEREDGPGAVVRMWLPLDGDVEDRDGAPAQRSSEKRADTSAPSTGPATERVLVVEDDADVRRYVVATLESLGHHVVSESNGASGLERIRSDRGLTMMVTDVVMPGATDGLALVALARRERPDLGIVVVTGFAPKLGRVPTANDGFVLLPKPFDRSALERALERARVLKEH